MSYEKQQAMAMDVDGGDSGKRVRDCGSQGGGARLRRPWFGRGASSSEQFLRGSPKHGTAIWGL
jgi:hypothetical protein